MGNIVERNPCFLGKGKRDHMSSPTGSGDSHVDLSRSFLCIGNEIPQIIVGRARRRQEPYRIHDNVDDGIEGVCIERCFLHVGNCNGRGAPGHDVISVGFFPHRFHVSGDGRPSRFVGDDDRNPQIFWDHTRE